MKTRHFTAVLVCLMTVILASCSAVNANSEMLTIELWADSSSSAEFLLDAAQMYSNQSENTEIHVVQKSGEVLREDFIIASRAGLPPQLVWGTGDHVGQFMAEGSIRPVERLYDPEAFLPTLDFQGQSWAVPMFAGNQLMLFYNSAIIAQPPTSFSQLISQAERVSGEDIYGLAINASEPLWFIPFYFGYGGRIFADDGVTPSLNNEAMVKALELMVSLVQDYDIMPPDNAFESARRLFAAGQVAFIIDGDWSIDGYREALGNGLGVMPIPVLPGGEIPRPFMQGVYLGVGSGVDEQQQMRIREFVAFLGGEGLQVEGAAELGLMPASLEALYSVVNGSDLVLAGAAEQVVVAVPQPANPEMQAVWDAMAIALNQVLDGSLTAAEAAAEMQRLALAALDS